MPKVAPEGSCGTCLSRKVKCDGRRPICQKCTAGHRHCDRSARALKFVIHKPSHTSPIRSSPSQTLATFYHSPTELSPPPVSIDTQQSPHDLDRAGVLAAASPRVALADPAIANLFAHYVTALAPWYDLNDSQQLFGTLVPLNALECPVLFKALLAFSASHRSKTCGKVQDIASAFHAACVQEFLLLIDKAESRSHGYELAATCLLRSYEIIDGDTANEQRHLLGAYSFAVSEPIDFRTCGLLQAGAWNYLREEITVALENRRPVRTGRIFESHTTGTFGDDMLANDISYILARILNFCYPDLAERTSLEDRIAAWRSLYAATMEWRKSLPPSFEPYSTSPKPGNLFPSLWMLRPWHVAAQQYFAVAEILLMLFNPSPVNGHLCQADLELAEDRALRVCGLAWTNDDIPARVNAFGPLAFCGRYLASEHHRKALEALLIDSGKQTAWPTHLIIQDLKQYWGSV